MKNFVKITLRKSRNSFISNLKSSSCVKFKFCRKHSKSFYSQENMFKKIFSEVHFEKGSHFEIDAFINECRKIGHFEIDHFRRRVTSKLFLKWRIFRSGHFRNDRLRRDLFFEVTHFSKWYFIWNDPFCEVIDFLVPHSLK